MGGAGRKAATSEQPYGMPYIYPRLPYDCQVVALVCLKHTAGQAYRLQTTPRASKLLCEGPLRHLYRSAMFCLPLGKRSLKQASLNFDDGEAAIRSTSVNEKGAPQSPQAQVNSAGTGPTGSMCHVTAAFSSDEAANRLGKLRSAMVEHKIDY